jgi:hypothetical protein
MKKTGIKSFFAASGPAAKKQRVDPALADTAADTPAEAAPAPAGSSAAAAAPVAAAAASSAAAASAVSPSDADAAGAGAAGDGDGDDDLFSTLNGEWKTALSAELKKSYMGSLDQYVRREYRSGPVFPPRPLVFEAMNACPLSQLKVVMLGQDPYHGPGQVSSGAACYAML